jgi:predicted HNH restriction endonuclease
MLLRKCKKCGAEAYTEKEIDKCILVCANCHRIIHAEEKE